MTAPGNSAVFLSYASQDAEAARRICEALRAGGIEVWFDQSELRGGDAWDAAIRKQIKGCGLFIPIISQNTHARGEGYFRLEWKLAVDRSHLMSGDVPYLVPVTIDGTRDDDERTPERFREVQWTRLPRGETPSSFVERVARLLTPEYSEPTPRALTTPPIPTPHRPKAKNWLLGAGLAALLAVIGGVYITWRALTPAKHAPTAITSVTAPRTIPEKSIAVLPFVDMSEKKDQEYFSDGLSEELIEHLSHVPDLKVIARTSSFAFKGKNEDMRSIASKLGVANLLEGSVRKAGKNLRITAQLIRATDGVHLWSEIYDRNLTGIFKIQDEISTTVAKALSVALSAATSAVRPESNPSTNVAAYNLLLKGNYYFYRGDKDDDNRAVESYRQAVTISPQYALAWAQLARVYAWQGYTGKLIATQAETNGREAAARALAIDPKSAAAYYARGNILRLLAGDWVAAMDDYQRATVLDPNGEVGHRSQGTILLLKGAMSGRYNEYVDWLHHFLDRNPLNMDSMQDLGWYQQADGNLGASAADFRKLLSLNPTYAGAQAQYSLTLLLLEKNAEALAAAKMEPDDASRLAALVCVYWTLKRWTESDSALGELEQRFADSNQYSIADAHAWRGDVDAAFAWLDRAYQKNKGSLQDLKSDRLLESLRNDPRFNALLRKLKLPEWPTH